MTQDDFKLLKALRSELQFVESGGYKRSERTPWRAPFIFEDSPICVNHGSAVREHPCHECLLIKFVLEARKHEASPCQFVPLTEASKNIHLLYRYGTEVQLEEALTAWLRRQIGEIEAELAKAAKFLAERTPIARMLPGFTSSHESKQSRSGSRES